MVEINRQQCQVSVGLAVAWEFECFAILNVSISEQEYLGKSMLHHWQGSNGQISNGYWQRLLLVFSVNT